MLSRLARFVTSHSRQVLLLAFLIVLAAAAYGSSAVSHLSSGGFTDSSSPSTKADALLSERFHQGDPNLVFLLQSPSGVNSAAARSVGTRLATDLAGQADVKGVASYWTVPPAARAGFVSKDGLSGLVTAHVLGSDNVTPKRGAALAERYDGTRDGVTVRAGGLTVANDQISNQISHDLSLAESVAIPLTLVALVFVFGSFIAALLPLAVGGVAIVGTLAVLRLLTLFVPVSVYALNLTTALGLGLAIDYSLFIVSRYREELAQGKSVADAVQVAVRSAGRTVLFSSVTVGLSMAAMLVFPFYFLRSFAYAGLAVVVIAALGAVVILPALLSTLGRRVNSLDVRPTLRRWLRVPAARAETTSNGGFWHRLALAVMRRPWAFGLAVVAVLLLLGAPFLSVRFGLPDDRVLPASAGAHQVGNVLRSDFDQNSANALTVVLPELGTTSPAQLSGYAAQLSMEKGAASVTSPEGTFASGKKVEALSTPMVGPQYLPDHPEQRQPVLERRPGPGQVGPVGAGAGRGPGHRVGGPQPRLAERPGRGTATGPWAYRPVHPGRVVLVHPQLAHPGQSSGAERALAFRHVRGDGVDLPGGPSVRSAGWRRGHRVPERQHAHPHVLHRLRSVHGLRGLPALPDQGRMGPF